MQDLRLPAKDLAAVLSNSAVGRTARQEARLWVAARDRCRARHEGRGSAPRTGARCLDGAHGTVDRARADELRSLQPIPEPSTQGLLLSGREVFSYPPGGAAGGGTGVMALAFETEPTFTPTQLFEWNFATCTNRRMIVSPDGQRFLLVADATENTDGEATQPQMVVVQNWFEELRRLVPTN